MPKTAGAADAISPSFEQAKRDLFRPFLFGRWMRLATIGAVTGELSGGSFSFPSGNFNLPSSSQPEGKDSLAAVMPPWEIWQTYAPWVVAGVAALVCLVLLWMYAESVYRFILFDAVLRGKYELREGWRRWRESGRSYFCWQVVFGVVTMLVMGLLLGAPALHAWRAGWFDHAEDHVGALVLLVLFAVFAFLSLIVAVMLISLAARDFVVPVMGLENVGVMEGWRRALGMMRGQKGPYAFYVLLKIGLGMAAAIVFGIVGTILLLCLLVPGAIAVAAVVLAANAGGMTWNEFTISAVIVTAAVGILLAMFVSGFVYAPALVFFQSYTLRFLGQRYEKLGAELAARDGALTTTPTPETIAGTGESPA